MATITPLPKFADSRGWSLNDIYSKVPLSARQQTNFSILYPGIVKAWHRHKNQDDYFCVLTGMAQVGVYSDKNGAEKFFIGEHNPAIVHIKAGEWHGLTAIGDKPVGLLYMVTNTYNPSSPDEERAGYKDFVDDNWWKPENK
jgi:dTDP-4-dehydrorhamnose 3,5-epimerase